MKWLLILCTVVFSMPLLAAKYLLVTITQSASTNKPGISLIVSPQCEIAASELSHGRGNPPAKGWHATLDSKLCENFMTELDKAGPLENISSDRCMKSASFGTSLTISTTDGEVSPDLTCVHGVDALVQATYQMIGAAKQAKPMENHTP